MPTHATLAVQRCADEDLVVQGRTTTRTPVEFDDWTVDGVRLRELVPPSAGGVPPLRTFMTSDRTYWSLTSASLLALLGASSTEIDERARFGDGRVGLLFCSNCGDLDCSTLSASIEFADTTVTWRDIAYQVGYEPQDLTNEKPFTVTFDRNEYEAVITQLLGSWTEKTRA